MEDETELVLNKNEFRRSNIFFIILFPC